MVPRAGIRIINEGVEFEPVGPAEYRVDTIKFDEIMKGINIYLSKQPLGKRMEVSQSWERLRKKIESLPERSENFPKMKLNDLPRLVREPLHVPDHLMEEEEDADNELTGDIYPEDVTDGDVDSEISLGMDVCIYTESKRGRPWVGRIVQLLEGRRFIIHWYSRKSSRSKLFEASYNADGSRSVSEMENQMVMFWQMTHKRTQTSFYLETFWLETIEREYNVLDGE